MEHLTPGCRGCCYSFSRLGLVSLQRYDLNVTYSPGKEPLDTLLWAVTLHISADDTSTERYVYVFNPTELLQDSLELKLIWPLGWLLCLVRTPKQGVTQTTHLLLLLLYTTTPFPGLQTKICNVQTQHELFVEGGGSLKSYFVRGNIDFRWMFYLFSTTLLSNPMQTDVKKIKVFMVTRQSSCAEVFSGNAPDFKLTSSLW